MPGAHRHDDSRFCGALTVVTNQSTVFVEDKLWAVKGDPNSHVAGNLIPKFGALNVYIEDKLIIVAVGDTAASDLLGHTPGPVDPKTASGTTFSYE
jgi:hypothetical protein